MEELRSIDEPVVTIKQGRLKGKIAYDAKNNKYYSFQGIPYAAPPIGDLRFKAPKPAEPWEGIRDATKEGNRSISRNMRKQIIGSEDCLYLNVYTKKLPNENTPNPNFPVLFWIHGGGFMTGCGNADLFAPDFLIVEDIIIVTINYRLGLLGFLSFEDPSLETPGNAGLKDMVAALFWVRNNIEVFGGDPNRITVAGESAGGAAAQLVASCSPLVPKGTVYACIAQSGTAFSPWARCVRRGLKFARAISEQPDTIQTDRDALEVLKSASHEELLDALDKVADMNDKLSFRMIGPIVETSCSSEKAFLLKDPIQTYEDGEMVDVPLMIGFNDADGMIYASTSFRDRAIPVDFTDVEDVVPHHEMGLIRGTPKSRDVGRKIREYYYGYSKPNRSTLANYVKLQTDIKFTLITNKVIKAAQRVHRSPIYLYRFSVDTPNNLYKKFLGLNLPGAAHGDELTFLFKTNYPTKFPIDSLEERTLQRMTKLWTNFVKRANPNSSDNDIEVVWEPVRDNCLNHLEIGAELKSIDGRPENERMKFWDMIFSKHSQL